MIIKAITASNEMWNKVKNYADSCSWKAGKSLASAMMNNGFKDWEKPLSSTEATECNKRTSLISFIGAPCTHLASFSIACSVREKEGFTIVTPNFIFT